VAGAAVRVVRIAFNEGMPAVGEGTAGPDGRFEIGGLAPADVALMRAHGVHAFLVGEAFMRAATSTICCITGTRASIRSSARMTANGLSPTTGSAHSTA
jgi:hypothetical protein